LRYGPDWEKLRKSVEQPLQKVVSQQFDKIVAISEEFTERILTIRNKQEEVPNYFKNEIYKWCLECLCSVTLNKKLGFLDLCGLSSTSDPGRLLDGLIGATKAIRKCEYGFHLWKFMETPAWKALVRNCGIIDGVLDKHIQRAMSNLRERKDKRSNLDNNISLLEVLLLKEEVAAEDVMTVLLDMFLIGINATAHTVAFIFYHLARNPRCQIKLYEEIRQFEGNLNKEDVNKMKYLNACIKETLRLDPPIPILSRHLNNDIVINHYLIPKGTHILFATHLNSMREEYFEDALKFKPERWLANELGGFGNDFQVFASMPFGHGPKACLAKELVELEIALLLAKVFQKFKIEYNYGDMQSSNELLASPTKPLKFRFIHRI
ncbi:probable cytochrome P450 301a1, mitochondrial, partial [Anoplophora glabripennis]|uniref:probable cytochrome P450 301a1, mitochondrial n=1 Tax=Anoplophora glabripennis TaxID=217634 RepID=UPI0008752527